VPPSPFPAVIPPDHPYHRPSPAATRAGPSPQPSRLALVPPTRPPHQHQPITTPYHHCLPSLGHPPTRGLLPPPNRRPRRGVSTRLPSNLQNRWTPPPLHGLGPRWTPPTPRAFGPPQPLPTALPHHTLPPTLPPPLWSLTSPAQIPTGLPAPLAHYPSPRPLESIGKFSGTPD